MYEAIYCLLTRDIKTAASLFLDSVATFTSTELISFSDLVFYTVITSIMVLGRAEIKKNVI